MTQDIGSALNVGQLLRDGVRLSTAEVLAIVHAACTQLSNGATRAVPRHPDGLWITDAGNVLVKAPESSDGPRSAVASLLDALLPAPSDEAAYVVPAPLRTLAARLRESGETASNDVKDLLTILSRYLRADPRDLLQQLELRARRGVPAAAPVRSAVAAPAARVAAPTGSTTPAPPHGAIPARTANAPVAGDVPRAAKVTLPAAKDVPPVGPVAPPDAKDAAPVVRVAPPAAKDAQVVGAAPRAAKVAPPVVRAAPPVDGADLPLNVAAPVQSRVGPTPRIPDRATGRPSNRAALVVLSVLLLLMSAVAGYWLSSRPAERADAPVVDDAPAAAAVEPRIVPRDEPPRRAARPVEPERPQPLMLPVSNGAFSPSFASDGTLLFHAGRNSSGQLFTTKVDAQGRTASAEPLLNDRARNYHPRLSPDGSRLAFDSDREGERAVYIADRNGQQIRRISGRGYAAVPSWSPDGAHLAFIKAETDRARVWNLWLMEVATGELRRLTTFRTGQVWGASWFPDGHRLAYSHEDRLIVSDLRSGAQEVFQSPVRGRLVRTPAVSPDGQRIVFQVYRDGVWMLDAANGATRRVLDDPTAEEFAWDAAGRRIAYHSRRDGRWRIWLMAL